MENEVRFAVLIDADNISERYIKIILEEVENDGIITYKRIYGDWTSPRLSSWKRVLLENSIIPIQQYGYTTGKNSTDSAIIIDAMDILYSGTVGGFCIVSSDSDFTRLAARLRESGMKVLGMGESKTPKPFISACNQFKYLDKLYEKRIQEQHEDVITDNMSEEQKKEQDFARINKTVRAIIEKFSDEDGWIFSGKLGDQLSKRLPDFDVRNYGFTRLTPFMKALGDYEINKVSIGKYQNHIYFRIKDAGAYEQDAQHKESYTRGRSYKRSTYSEDAPLDFGEEERDSVLPDTQENANNPVTAERAQKKPRRKNKRRKNNYVGKSDKRVNRRKK